MVGNIILVLLEIYCSLQQWKNFANRSRIDKVINMLRVAPFFWLTLADTVLIVWTRMWELKTDAEDWLAVSTNLLYTHIQLLRKRWRCQLGHWGTLPSTSNSLVFFTSLYSCMHEFWQHLCSVASPNIHVFVFCDSSCGSSVAATWSLLWSPYVIGRPYIFFHCIISSDFMCDKKIHVVLCSPRTRSWRRHWKDD